MTTSIPLSQLPLAYTGLPQVMEVQPFTRDIYDAPGVYLQKVEGCGYDVFTLTADEADKLGDMLKEAAAKTRAEFSRS